MLQRTVERCIASSATPGRKKIYGKEKEGKGKEKVSPLNLLDRFTPIHSKKKPLLLERLFLSHADLI
jgi:hypothetical protein